MSMQTTINTYNRPWSLVDDEELALLRKIERIMRQQSQTDPLPISVVAALVRLDRIRSART